MTKDEYPEESELKEISEWDYKDFHGMMDLVQELWTHGAWHRDGDIYAISTMGWSGNESLIDAMGDNAMFWSLCWTSSMRGGHYTFDVKDIK